MTYETKEEAMQHISTTSAKVAKVQQEMIDCMYGVGLTVSQKDLDNIALDAHKSSMQKAMSY